MKSHVGICESHLSNFTDGKSLYCLRNGKQDIFKTSPSRIGIESDYYENDVEHGILGGHHEPSMKHIFNRIISLPSTAERLEYVNSKKNEFISLLGIMYMRSKKTLVQCNENGFWTKILGGVSHSVLIRAQNWDNANITAPFFDEPHMSVIENCSSTPFINNSLGFYITAPEGKPCFFIPINASIGVLVHGKFFATRLHPFFVEFDGSLIKAFNRQCALFEKMQGNGFLVSKDKESLEEVRTVLQD